MWCSLLFAAGDPRLPEESLTKSTLPLSLIWTQYLAHYLITQPTKNWTLLTCYRMRFQEWNKRQPAQWVPAITPWNLKYKTWLRALASLTFQLFMYLWVLCCTVSMIIIKTKLLSSMTVMAVRSFCSNITRMQSRKTLQI